jgi:hypothetical protein
LAQGTETVVLAMQIPDIDDAAAVDIEGNDGNSYRRKDMEVFDDSLRQGKSVLDAFADVLEHIRGDNDRAIRDESKIPKQFTAYFIDVKSILGSTCNIYDKYN